MLVTTMLGGPIDPGPRAAPLICPRDDCRDVVRDKLSDIEDCWDALDRR